MRNRVIGLGLLGVAFGLGAVAGHLVTKRRLEMEFYGKLDAELEAARKYYLKLAKREEYSDPSKVADRIVPEERVEQEEPEDSEEEEEDDDDDLRPTYSVRVSPRDGSEDRFYKLESANFDYRNEVPKRNPKIPYVISYDEYFENPKDYDQRTITYFSKDDVLVEERDTPIEDVLGIVGPNALDQFGHGSNDPNIVYVRNDHLSMDFEICWDPDSFEETVLGQIKHSEGHKVRKFRIDDD